MGLSEGYFSNCLRPCISCDYSTLYLHMTNVHVFCLPSVQTENNSLVVAGLFLISS